MVGKPAFATYTPAPQLSESPNGPTCKLKPPLHPRKKLPLVTHPLHIKPPQAKAYSQLSLLGVIPEMRVMIWETVFDKVHTSQDLEALLICKQVYFEAARIAFSRSSFVLDNGYWGKSKMLNSFKLRLALSANPFERASMIKTIQIMTFPSTYPRTPTILQRLADRAEIRPSKVILRHKTATEELHNPTSFFMIWVWNDLRVPCTDYVVRLHSVSELDAALMGLFHILAHPNRQNNWKFVDQTNVEKDMEEQKLVRLLFMSRKDNSVTWAVRLTLDDGEYAEKKLDGEDLKQMLVMLAWLKDAQGQRG